MRIGIDATVLDRKITGTSRYLKNILDELPNQDEDNKYFIFSNTSLELDNSFYEQIVHKKSFVPLKIYSPYWLNFVLPRLLKKYKIDLLFSPNILIPIVNLGEIKTVSVVHDVIPKVYPEYYPSFYKRYLAFFLPRSLKKSTKVVTVSEYSKSDISKFYNIPLRKIEVVYNTASPEFVEIDTVQKVKEIPELPDSFILYVGVVEKRKNIIGLLRTMDQLRSQGSRLNLVIVGRKGFDYSQIAVEITKRRNFVKHFLYIPDDKLIYIYNRAFLFLFPSLYEGFGIPPLEAMQCGLPVLAANKTSLPEVVGDGGILHEPDDYAGFADDILQLSKNPELYQNLKLKALNQAKKFRIQDTTKKLVGIFNDLSENTRENS